MSNTPNLLKGQLLNYHEQLEQMQGNVMAFLMFSKIREFYNNFGIRINTLLKERFELMCTYHETATKTSDTGETYQELVWNVDDKGRKTGYKLRDGVTYEQFQEAYKSWASSPLGSTLTLVN